MGMEEEGTMRVLTKNAKAEYVKRGGTRCLFCGGQGIEGELVDVDAGTATQRVSCADCGGEWTDCYELKGVLVD